MTNPELTCFLLLHQIHMLPGHTQTHLLNSKMLLLPIIPSIQVAFTFRLEASQVILLSMEVLFAFMKTA